jgi:hypothetical protein
VQVTQEKIEHVTQAGNSVTHAVGELQPAAVSFYLSGAESVFDFLDGVILLCKVANSNRLYSAAESFGTERIGK